MTGAVTEQRHTVQSMEPDGGDGDVQIRRYVAILWEGRWVILACFIVVFAVVLISTLAQTPIYRAAVQMQLDPSVTNPLSVSDTMGSNYSQYWINESFYNTQAKVIRSRPLAEAVLELLDLKKVEPYRTAKDPAALVMGRIQVERVADTQLIDVSITGPDPEETARLANAVAAAYIEMGIGQRRQKVHDFLVWYQKQLTELAVAVEQGDEAILGELEKNDLLVGPEGRVEIVEQRISQLTEDLTKAKTERLRMQAVIDQIHRNSGNKLSIPDVQNDPAVADLNKQLVGLDVELTKLLTQFRDKHPEVIKVKGERDQIQQRLFAEADRIIGRVENEYEILKAQEGNLASSLEEQKAEAREIQRRQLGFQSRATNQEQRKAILEQLQAISQQTALTSEFQGNNTRIVNPAVSPTTPVRPNKRANILVGAVGGLLLGGFVVLLLDYLDNTIRSAEQVEQYLRLHLLTYVPTTSNASAGSIKEAYHTLRTGMLFANRDKTPKVVLVTSAGPSEGKTSTALNLAQILAVSGDRVVLVDCDLRRPSVHRYLKLNKQHGIMEYVVGNGELSSYLKETSVPRLRVLTSGPIPPNPPEMLDHERFLDIFPRLRRDFDWIVVDSPPVLSVTDPIILASLVDGVIMVVQHSRYPREMVRRAVNQLRNVNANLLGAVLNNVNIARDAYYYGYYHSYDYAGDGGGRADGGNEPTGGAPPTSAEQPADEMGRVGAGRTP